MKKLILALSCAACVAGVVFATLADGSTNAPAAGDKPVKPYLLKTCIVSGEKLGEMGDGVTITNDGRQIKFCCKDCVGDFKKNPAKFTKKIEAQEKKLAKDTTPAK